jgi:hypothetical protein
MLAFDLSVEKLFFAADVKTLLLRRMAAPYSPYYAATLHKT